MIYTNRYQSSMNIDFRCQSIEIDKEKSCDLVYNLIPTIFGSLIFHISLP